jgi:hypothetical protein
MKNHPSFEKTQKFGKSPKFQKMGDFSNFFAIFGNFGDFSNFDQIFKNVKNHPNLIKFENF